MLINELFTKLLFSDFDKFLIILFLDFIRILGLIGFDFIPELIFTINHVLFRIESVPCQEMVSEDDISVVDSDYESDEGPFSFRRRPGVEYLAPLQSEPGDKARMIENLDHSSDKDRFIWTQIPGICVAYCRYFFSDCFCTHLLKYFFPHLFI